MRCLAYNDGGAHDENDRGHDDDDDDYDDNNDYNNDHEDHDHDDDHDDVYDYTRPGVDDTDMCHDDGSMPTTMGVTTTELCLRRGPTKCYRDGGYDDGVLPTITVGSARPRRWSRRRCIPTTSRRA